MAEGGLDREFKCIFIVEKEAAMDDNTDGNVNDNTERSDDRPSMRGAGSTDVGAPAATPRRNTEDFNNNAQDEGNNTMTPAMTTENTATRTTSGDAVGTPSLTPNQTPASKGGIMTPTDRRNYTSSLPSPGGTPRTPRTGISYVGVFM